MAQLHACVVDDDPIVCDAVRLCLSDLGYSVSIAGAAHELAALIETFVFDLIVCDLQIPGEADGACIALVRSKTPATPVVAMSAMPAGRDLALRLGAHAFAEKPASARTIAAAIDAAFIASERQSLSPSQRTASLV